MDAITEKQVTPDDLIKLSQDGRYELIEGVIYKMAPAGEEHGFVALNIGTIINNFVRKKRLGITTGAETGYKLASDPDTVKSPDVAFKSNNRLAEKGLSKGYSTVMPELVIEVNSPFDSYTKILKKIQDWLKARVLEVWVVEPEDSSIVIYDSSGNHKILEKKDEIEGGEILPGFKCKVSEFFDY